VFVPPPNPELLSSLGRLVRGLSVLFWGLPLGLIVCVQSARGDWFRPLGVVPAVLVAGLLCYGLSLLESFQQQERIWIAALDRARAVALFNLGCSPFLYWWSRVPSHPFLTTVVQCLMISGVAFLILINPLLVRLTSMLPDETLRLETRFFTLLNRYILIAILCVLSAYFIMVHVEPGLPDRLLSWLLRISPLPPRANALLYVVDRAGPWIVLFFILLPLAMTMALLWKIKEVILASVFGPDH
jgi:hypothetical protein